MKTKLLTLTLLLTPVVVAAPLTDAQLKELNDVRRATHVQLAKTDKIMAELLCNPNPKDEACLLQAYRNIDAYKKLVIGIHETDKKYYEQINRK